MLSCPLLLPPAGEILFSGAFSGNERKNRLEYGIDQLMMLASREAASFRGGFIYSKTMPFFLLCCLFTLTPFGVPRWLKTAHRTSPLHPQQERQRLCPTIPVPSVTLITTSVVTCFMVALDKMQ